MEVNGVQNYLVQSVQHIIFYVLKESCTGLARLEEYAIIFTSKSTILLVECSV